MTTIYTAQWLLPISSSPVRAGALAVDGSKIVGVGPRDELIRLFPGYSLQDLGAAIILPGLVNAHSHLELTVMRGYLENEETNFFSWLRKLTLARLNLMTDEDVEVSALWGACEAVRAGVTAVGDASDLGRFSMKALKSIGLRGIVFQESFGPDASLAQENFGILKTKVAELQSQQTELVRVGVSPHSPYTVSGPQLELIAAFALKENLPLMIHAAESVAEELLVRNGTGLFAEGLQKRNIRWNVPGVSPIQHLNQRGILATKALLAHCIRVDQDDLESISRNGAMIAHCPKSNAKLGHGFASLTSFLKNGINVGLGSDSVASNNTCDIIEETRFASLLSRAVAPMDNSTERISNSESLRLATSGGASCLGITESGSLRVGANADFIAVSTVGTHQTPDYDPEATLLFASSGRDVVLTVVAGRELYRDGRVMTVDEERLNARINEVSGKLLSHEYSGS
ncbi:MAG TPA: amidohydrolase family protein [Pyrinomonadaceae bacterium]|nr:amidohydrolase family protein [Pyrinomonadaceae bacterium]